MKGEKPSVIDRAAARVEPALHKGLGEFGLRRLGPVSLENVAQEKKQKGGNLDVYLHFPFCAEICTFCAFHRQLGSPQQRETYVQSLEQTINDALPKFGQDQKASSIYMGGGTPGMLSLDQAGRILSAVRGNMDTSGATTKFELHPENVDPDFVRGLQGLGVDKFSVGVQNLSEGERGVLKRTITSGEEDIRRLQMLNDLGVPYNIDLMFGTPNQTPDSWRDTFTRIVDEVHPPEMTLYQYVNAHGAVTPRLIASGELERPGVKARHGMYRDAQAYLIDNGYRQTGTLSFSRDQEAEEKQLLRNGRDFFGIGPKTYSSIGRHMFINDARTRDFRPDGDKDTQRYFGIRLPRTAEWALENGFGLFARQRTDGHPVKAPAFLDPWKSEGIAQTYGVLYYMTNQPTFDRRNSEVVYQIGDKPSSS